MTTRSDAIRALKRLAQACVLGAAFAAAPLSSSLGAALVINGYYEDSKSVSCAGATFCVATFGAVPALKYLVVSHINCRIAVAGSTGLLLYAFIGGNGRNSELHIALRSGTATNKHYDIDSEIQKPFAAAQAPMFSITFGPPASQLTQISCTIEGQLYAT